MFDRVITFLKVTLCPRYVLGHGTGILKIQVKSLKGQGAKAGAWFSKTVVMKNLAIL